MSDDRLYHDIVERELFLIAVADGIPEENAGYEVGWTPTQTRRNLQDTEFAEMVDAARRRADGTIEAALFRLAKNGNLGAMQMWLYNRTPERWKDVKRIEVKNETTINVGVIASTKQAVLELLAETGPAALQPVYQRDDIIDAEIVSDSDDNTN